MRLIKSGLFFLALMVSTNAIAVVINFDDMTGSIPSGYQGLEWDNFSILAGATNPGSGYEAGVISQPNVAYNSGGSAASVTDGEFSLCSAWLTGAWNDGLEVTVEGWMNNNLVYSQMVVVNTTVPQQIQYNFNGIDELRFSSTGGVDAGTNGSGTHFVMDDMEVLFGELCSGEPSTFETEPVPSFSSWSLISLLLLISIVGFASLRRRV